MRIRDFVLPLLISSTALVGGHVEDPAQILWFDSPATSWEKQGLPIGNGSIGAMMLGTPDRGVLQFTVDSLWSGDANPGGGYKEAVNPKKPQDGAFGSFQNFGELRFKQQTSGNSGSSQVGVSSTSPPSNGNEGADKAADGNAKSKWCVSHKGQAIDWLATLTSQTKVAKYHFISGSDVPGRDPYAWKLEGSNDGSAWTLLDERENVAPMDQRGGKRAYKIASPQKFLHYRFTFSPRPGVAFFQVADIVLHGVKLGDGGVSQKYCRMLDIQRSRFTESWEADGVVFRREAIASYPRRVIGWRISANKPGAISGMLSFAGAHPKGEKVVVNIHGIAVDGKLVNGLRYAGRVSLSNQGGKVRHDKEGIIVEGCDEILVLLAADTNYVMDAAQGWMKGDPAVVVTQRIKTAEAMDWNALVKEHEADYRKLYDRVKIDLGRSADEVRQLPLNQRIQRYRADAKELPRPCLDPELEALLFQYGRYLLISCSRQGSLPANLQGNWNNSNSPAWFADYHSNINIQMNYWLAETANLSELAMPLFEMLLAGVPVYTKHTKAEHGDDVEGFVTRMSINPYGGSGWNWNIEGTAWLAQHFWEHYAYNKNKEFLAQRAWPWLSGVSKFWLAKLVEMPDGSLLVPNVWSHEHGPHEDGTAHAQQLMWDLFGNTIQAAEILNLEPQLTAKLKDARERLYGPQIGSWGQLMEWMDEKPELEKGNHRHTSHLFAVHPGNQINRSTPEWLEGARVSLTKRGEVGDSRRSWTWAWRAALWARLGDAERAHGCVAGLLAHNMYDNLWATHPPFQIDGNLGITNGMCEMFLQSQSGVIELLPALSKHYPKGSVKGLRARGEVIVDLVWKGGKLTAAKIVSPIAQTVKVHVPGEAEGREVKLESNKPMKLK